MPSSGVNGGSLAERYSATPMFRAMSVLFGNPLVADHSIQKEGELVCL